MIQDEQVNDTHKIQEKVDITTSEKPSGLQSLLLPFSIQWQRPRTISDPIILITTRANTSEVALTSDDKSDSVETYKSTTTTTHRRTIAISTCHRIPERSVYFRGKPILCYRCTGVYLGIVSLAIYQIIGLLFGFGFLFGLDRLRVEFIQLTHNSIPLQFLVIILLHLPMVIDGGYQAMRNHYTSTNFRRFVTGFIAGMGQFAIVLLIGSIVRYF